MGNVFGMCEELPLDILSAPSLEAVISDLAHPVERRALSTALRPMATQCGALWSNDKR